MKSIALLGAACLLGLASCQTHQPDIYRTSHWNIQSLENRVAYHALGYQPELDSTYGEFRVEENRAIYTTLRRHFLNQNPSNPFQDWPDETAVERFPHDILINPLEIAYLGAVAAGVAAGAAGMIGVPVDYMIGSADTALHEFDDHIGTSTQATVECFVTGSFRKITRQDADSPTTPVEFRIRNTNVR